MKLRGGAQTDDARLDRVYELDLRSLNYLAGPSSGVPPRRPRSYTWKLDTVLDQGQEGSCVGHGYAHELLAKPQAVPGVTHEYAVEAIYWPAQREDPWDGGSYPGAAPVYEGTSVLTGAKVLKDRGYYGEYRWALTAIDVADALGYNGPVVLGVKWSGAMYSPDAAGFLRPTGALVGGHCICAIGVHIAWRSWYNRLISATWDNVDLDASYVTLHNSWGPSWGANGRAKLSLTDLSLLLSQQGEACIPTRTRLLTLV